MEVRKWVRHDSLAGRENSSSYVGVSHSSSF